MKHTSRLGALLLAVMALGLVFASSALAASTNDPIYLIENKEFKGNEEVEAVQSGAQKLKGTGVTLECQKLGLKAGATIGGATLPGPGTSKETIEYSECTVVGFNKCKVNGALPGKITTEPLVNLLIYLTKAGAEKEETTSKISGTLFKPEAGTKFVKIGLTPEAECPVKEVVVEGSVVVENGTPNTNEKEHSLTATAKKEYFLNNAAKKTTEKFAAGLTVAGLAATYEGVSKVKLVKKPTQSWSIGI